MATPDRERRGESGTNPYEPPKAAIDPSLQEPSRWLERPFTERRRPAPAAQFSLDCPCGQTVTVAASQAGSAVRCACGAELKVPSLGRLRELSGKDRYESGPGDTIRRIIQSGELPAGRTCVLSGQPTDDVLLFEVLLPKFFKYQAAEDYSKLFVLMALLGWLGMLLLGLFSRPKFDAEGALTVQAPLRIAARYHSKVRRMGDWRLRRLLRTVPVYALLLGENPFARVFVAKPEP
jgi:hypothetical protein